MLDMSNIPNPDDFDELSGKERRHRMKRYICEGIVKGATHVRNQMPCQDNRRIVEISDKIAIVAVADGHGNSKYPRSDRESMIAVNSFYEVMKKNFGYMIGCAKIFHMTMKELIRKKCPE